MAVVPDNDAELSTDAAPTDLLPFRCEVSQFGDRAVVLVRGDVDLATAPIVIREALAAFTLRVASVTVDLGFVTFLDSSGVAALDVVREAAKDQGVVFTLDAIPINVRRVLEVAGMLSVFHHDDVHDR